MKHALYRISLKSLFKVTTVISLMLVMTRFIFFYLDSLNWKETLSHEMVDITEVCLDDDNPNSEKAYAITFFNPFTATSSLKRIPSTAQISVLVLDGCSVNDEDIKLLVRHRRINRLYLRRTNISPRSINFIIKINGLLELDISDTALTYDDAKTLLDKSNLAALGKIPSLRYFNITNAGHGGKQHGDGKTQGEATRIVHRDHAARAFAGPSVL